MMTEFSFWVNYNIFVLYTVNITLLCKNVSRTELLIKVQVLQICRKLCIFFVILVQVCSLERHLINALSVP